MFLYSHPPPSLRTHGFPHFPLYHWSKIVFTSCEDLIDICYPCFLSYWGRLALVNTVLLGEQIFPRHLPVWVSRWAWLGGIPPRDMVSTSRPPKSCVRWMMSLLYILSTDSTVMLPFFEILKVCQWPSAMYASGMLLSTFPATPASDVKCTLPFLICKMD